MRPLTARAARGLLFAAQALASPQRAAVADVVRSVTAVQAQDARAGALGVRTRSAGLTAADVERALWQERSIVRIWCLRGTLHFVAAEDAGWLVALLGPPMLRHTGKRLRSLGVDTPEAVDAVGAAVAEQPRTRAAVAAFVRARGVRVADDPQTPAHLVAAAALHGRVVQVGVHGRDPVYGPAPPAPPAPAEPAVELARRHARAHPPSTPEDLARWSGLPMAQARRAFAEIAGSLDEVEVLGRRAWVPRALEPATGLRLLPAWDNFLLGHRDRSLVNPREIDVGTAGMVHPSVVVDGEVVGTWRRDEVVAPDDPRIAAELADVERFRSPSSALRARS